MTDRHLWIVIVVRLRELLGWRKSQTGDKISCYQGAASSGFPPNPLAYAPTKACRVTTNPNSTANAAMHSPLLIVCTGSLIIHNLELVEFTISRYTRHLTNTASPSSAAALTAVTGN